MTGTLTREVLARTAKRPNVRYGTVSSASNGLANVRIGSTVVENATWLSGYLPSVGDRVAVLASGTGWLILDAVERVQRAYNEPETILVPPFRIGSKWNPQWSASWDGSYVDPDAPPQLPTPMSRVWEGVYTRLVDPAERVWERTGYDYATTGGGSAINYVPASGYSALFAWYPQLSTAVPNEAVITSVAIIIRTPERTEALAEWAQPADSSEVVLHAVSGAVPSQGSGAGLPPETHFNMSFAPTPVADLTPGSLAATPLSDDLASALASGTVTGFGFWDGVTQKSTILADWVDWEYVYSQAQDRWSWQVNATTSDCLSLQVTYVTPYEDGE